MIFGTEKFVNALFMDCILLLYNLVDTSCCFFPDEPFGATMNGFPIRFPGLLEE